jgi:hypothetical protein
LTRQQPQESRIIARHFNRQIEFRAVRSSVKHNIFPKQFPQ